MQNPSVYKMLRILDAHEGYDRKDLAESLEVKYCSATISNNVKILTDLGWIKRLPNKYSFKKSYTVTEKGHSVCRMIEEMEALEVSE